MKAKKIVETILASVLAAASFIQMIPSTTVDSIFENSIVIFCLILCAVPRV